MSANDDGVLRLVGEASIARLALAKGDVLVVKVDRTIDSYMSSRIYGTIKPHLPGGVKVLVIDPAIDLSVLTVGDIKAMVG